MNTTYREEGVAEKRQQNIERKPNDRVVSFVDRQPNHENNINLNLRVNSTQIHIAPKCSPIGIFTPVSKENNKTNTKNTYSVNFSNESLCFFRAVVSCPSPSDLAKLMNCANKYEILPTGREIVEVLRQQGNETTGNKEKQQEGGIDMRTIPSMERQVNVIHADGGAAVSLIRESIAEQLGTPILELQDPLNILDINEGNIAYNKVCYVQVEIPNMEMFRAIVLCIVKKNAHIPFLLSNDDQIAHNIIPQADMREIRIGPQSNPHGYVQFLPYEEWKSTLQRASRVGSTLLSEENRSLRRMRRKGEESEILILGSSGMFQKKNQKGKDSKLGISSEEIRQAIRTGPTPEGPRHKEIMTVEHQIQLLKEPGVESQIVRERRLDQIRESRPAQLLAQAKLDSSMIDKQISELSQQVIQESIRTRLGKEFLVDDNRERNNESETTQTIEDRQV